MARIIPSVTNKVQKIIFNNNATLSEIFVALNRTETILKDVKLTLKYSLNIYL